MIFIFDWGHLTFREIGPLSKDDYENPFETDMAWLTVRKSWFRAFFIPTVPTETDYGLMDENENFHILEKVEFDRIKPLAELNAQVAAGEISDEDYDRRRSDLEL